jgi:hypothetical protein
MNLATRRTLARTALSVATLLAAAVTTCVTVRTVYGQPEMQFVTPDQLKWVDAPPGLPRGAKVAILQGDPTKPGPFTLRARMPAGYKIPAHWHPTDENVTVISGVFHMGMGEKLDTSVGHPLPAGGFMAMPARAHHFAWATRDTIIQVHGTGPFEITYINPLDDPRGR